MNNRNEQIKKVLSDEAFVKTLLEAENEEAVQKMLADKGLEMSLTEIELLGELIEADAQGMINHEAVDALLKDGELSEDDLKQAAGGVLNAGDAAKAISEGKKVIWNISGESTAVVVQEKLQNTIMPAMDKLVSAGGGNVGRAVAGTVGVVLAGLAAVGALGYGAYDAYRRRW